MAKTVSTDALIRVAPGTVWQTWRDLPRWPTWQPETEEVRWLPDEVRWQEGSRFEMLRRTPFRLLGRLSGVTARRFTGRVLAVSDEQLLVWELVPTRAAWLGPTLVESVRLAPAPGGTTVTLTLTAHGLSPTLLAPLLSGPLRAQAGATLEGLRRTLAAAERRL